MHRHWQMNFLPAGRYNDILFFIKEAEGEGAGTFVSLKLNALKDNLSFGLLLYSRGKKNREDLFVVYSRLRIKTEQTRTGMNAINVEHL